MNNIDDKILDLIQSENGVYTPKGGTRHSKSIKKEEEEKPLPDNIMNFFSGIDIGLSFLEGVDKRVKRMMKLKE